MCVCQVGLWEFSIGLSPVVQSDELGSVEKAALKVTGLWWATTIWHIKHQKPSGETDALSRVATVHNAVNQATDKSVQQERNTRTSFPFLPLHYPSLPSMFVLIDFCGVRSFWTAADRPAIHLEFKESSGRSVPLLFVLHRTTTSSGTLPCQQRGWQGN